ncbi:N-acetylglucosamine-6-phosphate deacetylase [Haloglycomyces albus]|uniref:N-acetylglucosamine-6-phosphate deacetylase n=1 Tax=Haloglycomyces albus TaxID=526067 RepID=UPI0004B0A472|nr:N-acetylglucosamine-6-phosphate deacetylase [Haloglycomyces albus]
MNELPAHAHVVTGEGVMNGTVIVDGDRIAGIEETSGEPDGWVIPGFIDTHTHGGGGYSFTGGNAEQARQAAAFHASRGTTTVMASLVSGSQDFLLEATKNLKPLYDDGTIMGVHYEGPYISPERRGAHDPSVLRDPSVEEAKQLMAAADGSAKMMTVAPELNGAVETIEYLASQGVVVALGHTDATWEQTVDGMDAGAIVATHLCNAMRPFKHRDPGPIPALLDDERTISEVIADPVHLHHGTMQFIFDTALPTWVHLVSDAMDAAGLDDGSYKLGNLDVDVEDGTARTKDGAIAGSTITLLDAFRNAVHLGKQSVPAASAMASEVPAETFGLTDVGTIDPGKRADLLVLDNDLELKGVMRAGEWLDAA